MEAIKRVLTQSYYIFKKNLLLDSKNKKEFIFHLIMSCLVSLIFALSNHLSNKILIILLPIYIGNLNISIIRKFTIYFIKERQMNYKKYQLIAGLNPISYLTGNLLYMYAFTSIVISPVFFVFISSGFKTRLVLYFLIFIMTSSNIILVLTLLFKNPRLASQVIGIVFSLSVFAFFIIDLNTIHSYTYLLLCFPANSFALSIIKDSLVPSSIVMLFSKLVMPIYSYFQLNIHPLKKCKDCAEKCRKKQNQIQSSQNIQKPILVIQNVSKIIDEQYIIKNISINVKQGEIIGILGISGSGKSSLIELLTDQYSEYQGKIQIMNEGSTGICYQQQMLYEDMTVEEIIKFYIEIKLANKEELQSVLNLVDLLNQRKKLVKYLSKGQRRKLSIAICILGQPSLLIFDEPTVGLDPFSRKSIWNIFIDLKKKKKTLLIVTHDFEQIHDLADNLYLFQNGIIKNCGSPLEIRSNFQKKLYYLKITGAINTPQLLNIQNEKLLTRKHSNQDSKIYQIYSDKISQQIFIQILQTFEKIPNISISVVYPSIQELYLNLYNTDPQNTTSNTFQVSNQPIPSQKREFKAMLLRKFYYLKGNYNSFFLYFSNVFFLTIGYFLYYNTLMHEEIKIQLILQGYYFYMSEFICLIVQEKQKNILTALKVKGLKWWSYWLSNIVTDYILILINIGLTYIFLKNILNFLELIFFGGALISFTYVCSYFYSNTINTVYFTVVNFYIYFSLPLLNLINIPFIKIIIFTIVEWLYPLYFFQNTLYNTSKHPLIYYFIFQFVFYTIIICINESSIIRKLRLAKNSYLIKQNIKLQNTSVIYDSTGEQSLKSINLYVQDNEILALLGPNGAGKSTLFKLLTHQIQQTTGSIYYQNQLCEPFFFDLGSATVCYEQDVFWENLTGRENIKIYSLLAGTSIQNEDKFLIKNFNLKFLDKQLRYFNKSSKKKYSFAFSLIGKSTIKLFDEFTTGLDPVSIKKIFSLLKNKQDLQTMVFSTHCLRQAELICNKFAILIKGQLIEHKTFKQLKEDYFPSSFIINLQLISNFHQIESILLDNLQQFKIQILEQTVKRVKVKIQKVNNSSQIFSKVYKKLVIMKKNRLIDQFNINEPNLQDIYLQIIKNFGTQF